jgi:hypothetical protein
MAAVVTAFGPCLVAPSPARPGEPLVQGELPRADHPTKEAAHLGHGERQQFFPEGRIGQRADQRWGLPLFPLSAACARTTPR